jgi:hypothetical protein
MGAQESGMDRHERALQDMRLQHAIRWISDWLQEEPRADRGTLIDAASRRFGLSPSQEEFLYHMYMSLKTG